MGKEHIGKSFRSGNSVAIRIPAALGVEPGQEWDVEQLDDGSLRLVRKTVAVPEKIDLSGVYGRGAGLKPLRPEDRVLEERELDWTGARLTPRD
jgi:antitoxin VapB